MEQSRKILQQGSEPQEDGGGKHVNTPAQSQAAARLQLHHLHGGVHLQEAHSCAPEGENLGDVKDTFAEVAGPRRKTRHCSSGFHLVWWFPEPGDEPLARGERGGSSPVDDPG